LDRSQAYLPVQVETMVSVKPTALAVHSEMAPEMLNWTVLESRLVMEILTEMMV